MLDSLAPGDVTIVAIGIALLVVFFFFGTHKIYESIVGSLLGILLYLFVDVFTQTVALTTNPNIVDEFVTSTASWLKSLALILTIALVIYCPISSMISMTPVFGNQIWRISKTLIYTVFYLLYVFALLSVIVYGPAPFDEVNFFSPIRSLDWWNAWIANSNIFIFAANNAFTIVFIGTFAMIVKILLGSVLNRILLTILTIILWTKNIITWRIRRQPLDEVVEQEEDPEEI